MIQAFLPQPTETLRKQAALFRRLAQSTGDPAVAARLVDWADRYEAEADARPPAQEAPSQP